MPDLVEMEGVQVEASSENLARPEKPDITGVEARIQNGEQIENFSLGNIVDQLRAEQARGKTFVITNGHFVLFHEGHSDSLLQAREVGTRHRDDHDPNGVVVLVIVNNDGQTFRKSPEKAAFGTSEVRAANVLNDPNTDFAVISEAGLTESGEVDPSVVTDFQKLEQAGLIGPNLIYVKGSDYTPATGDTEQPANVPPEAEIVLRNGGKFEIVPRRIDISTTQILEQRQAQAAVK